VSSADPRDTPPITGNNSWIAGLRLISYLIFAVIFAVGIYFGLMFISRESMTLGILIIVAGFLVAFMSVAYTMIFLNASQDIAVLRQIREREYYRG
jgi:hypothetical protein